MQDSILPAVGSLSTVSAAKLNAAYHAGKTDSGTWTAGGEDGAVGWEAGFPALGLVLIVMLTYAGVRPRLDEYR